MTAGIFYADQLDAVLRDSATAILDLLSALPGSRVVYKYIRNSHQDDPFRYGFLPLSALVVPELKNGTYMTRTLLELFLVFFLFWYFLRKKSKPDAANDIKLTEPVSCMDATHMHSLIFKIQEIQELIDEWEPEPLVAPLTDFEKSDIEKVPVIQGYLSVVLLCFIHFNVISIQFPGTQNQAF